VLTFDGRLRIDLYKRFMEDRGVTDRIEVHVSELAPDLGLELGRRIFASFDPETSPTAIFATSDTIAMGLMQAAYQAGIAMPDRLSIIGFDDIDFASYTIPPLTTISQSGVEMGRIATEVLLDMIDNARDRSEVNDVVLGPQLVIRGSTAPPFR
jgi:DNA-binding LacI/PurR family transcriptional regulator